MLLAIHMLFDQVDAIAVHTMIGAASNILSGLIAIKAPEKSWDKSAMEVNNLTSVAQFKVMRAPHNLFLISSKV